jgi:hypothetical protein
LNVDGPARFRPAGSFGGLRRREHQAHQQAAGRRGVEQQLAAQLPGEGGHQGSAHPLDRALGRAGTVVADRQLGLFAAHEEVDRQRAAALGQGVLLGVGDGLDREQGQRRQAVGVDDQRVGVDLGADRARRSTCRRPAAGRSAPPGTAAGPRA